MAFDWFRRKFSGDPSGSEAGAQAEPPAASEARDQPDSETGDSGAADPEAIAAAKGDDSGHDGSDSNDSGNNDSGSDGSGGDDESLAWAKAAFENIRRKQAEAAAQANAVASADTAIAPAAIAPTAIAPTTLPIEPVVLDTDAPSDDPTEDRTDNLDADNLDTSAAMLEVGEASTTAIAAVAIEPVVTEAIAIEPLAIEPIAIEPIAPELEPEPVATISEASDAEASDAETSEEPEESEEPATPEAPAPLSFLARAEAERAERLERLKATAIEEPEPEPEPEPSPELDSGPRIVFDADFLWSAEVLAAQGRRPEEISYEEITWLNRLRQGLGKTRRSLVNQLKAVVGQGPLNGDAVLAIESLLLQADVGVDATDYIIASLQSKLREEALPPAQAIAYLKRIIRELLDSPIKDDASIVLAPEKDQLNIWLMTGVNGAGKTTTIGKLAHLAQKSDYRCLIAAADTFRAAAVQQVQVWGDRSGIEVISNPGQNTDPAAVVFDAIAAAQARNTELLLVDTAGRLQNKKNLMDELSKVRRIIDKQAPGAKVESLLVLDSTLGQNGLRQAEVFAQSANLSGVVLTKLDGTARGGVALAIVRQLGLPIRFIGAGEGIGDLRPFSSYEFVEALLDG